MTADPVPVRVSRYLVHSMCVAVWALFLMDVTMSNADSGSAQADLQRVKQRTIELLAGGTGDGPHRQQAQAALDQRVEGILAAPAVQLRWEPADDAVFNQHLNSFLQTTRTLAEGYASDGRFRGDPVVLDRIAADLEHALSHYNADTPRPGNWYYWVIPIPDKLGAIGLLLQEDLPDRILKLLDASLTHQLKRMNLSGANAAWEARNHAYLALLQEDPVRLKAAADRIFSTVRYSSDGGVREDYSYLFHGHIPYAGVYGAGFAETVAQFMFLYDDTRWAPSPERRELLVKTLLEHSRWMIVGGVWDPIVCGRVYGSRRPADAGLTAMLYMTRVTHDQAGVLRGAVAALLADGMKVPTEVAAFADALEGISPAPVRGFRWWYTAEMGAWAAPDYHISFRQYSTRVQDYEYLTRTGAEGWNLAYGFTHISRTGQEWFAGDREEQAIGDVDFDHLAGTTSRVGAHPINDEASVSSKGHSLNFGRSEISGGASLGGEGLEDGGTTGFVLLPTHGDFVAHKSLSFFPGGFVALGSAISSQAPADETRPVHTTLLQWVTPDPQTALIINGAQVALSTKPTRLPAVSRGFIDGVGVIPLVPTDLWARRIGRVTTIWIDHGAAPQDEGYAYAILPATTLEATDRFAQDPPVQVLHRDGIAHIVTETITGSTGAVFFAAGAAAGFAVDSPAVLYQRGDDESGAVAVQDAMHRTATLDVTIPQSPHTVVLPVDEGIAVAARDPSLHLQVQGQLGRIYRAGWGATTQRLQPMPRTDLADFYAFRAEVEADAERAIFTLHLTQEPLREGYELQLEGRRGHLLHVFTEEDVLDRPSPGVVRYVWHHGQDGGEADDEDQREGDFRLLLYTDLKFATAYVTIPHFDVHGQPHPTTLPPDVNRIP